MDLCQKNTNINPLTDLDVTEKRKKKNKQTNRSSTVNLKLVPGKRKPITEL